MAGDRVDLLLLNASNYPALPIFPYAFVQLSALARRAGLRIARHDFLYQRGEARDHALDELLRRHRPRVVGFHLRQPDSLLSAEYSVPFRRLDYFPADDTRELVARVRDATDVPVAVGGIGFSSIPEQLYAELGVDLGIVGDPDAFFARFEDVAARRFASVDNALFATGRSLTRADRFDGAPLPEREYDDDIVRDLRAFYGEAALRSATPPTVAIELARGCYYRCDFCCEPHVKGRSVRVRDLDVVEEEVDFLGRHGLRDLWFVCSELNLHANSYAVALAERLIKVNERRPEALRTRWSAFYLPHPMPDDVFAVLTRSGFTGTWNEATSLDDRNLRALRVPYRTRHVEAQLRRAAVLRRSGSPPLAEALPATAGAAAESAVRYVDAILDLASGVSSRRGSNLDVFLGNAHADVTTVRETIARLHAVGLPRFYASARVLFSTRVFEWTDTSGREEGLVTFGRGETVPNARPLARPTYLYPVALLREFPSRIALEKFFLHLESVLLSAGHRMETDWWRHLATTIPRPWLAEQMARIPTDDLDAVADLLAQRAESVAATAGGEAHAALLRGGVLAFRAMSGDRGGSWLDDLYAPAASARELVNHLASLVIRMALAADERAGAALAAVGSQSTARGWYSDDNWTFLQRVAGRHETREQFEREIVDAVGDPSIGRHLAAFLMLEHRPTFVPAERHVLLGPSEVPLGHKEAAT